MSRRRPAQIRYNPNSNFKATNSKSADTKSKKRYMSFFSGLLFLVILAGLGYGFYFRFAVKASKNSSNKSLAPKLSFSTQEVTLSAGQKVDIPVDNKQYFASSLPEGVIKNDLQTRTKDVGEYKAIYLDPEKPGFNFHVYSIEVGLPIVDFDSLKSKVSDIIGREDQKYKVFLYDFKRDQGFSINGDVVTAPASISKVPYAILALRDVDAGKYTLESTFPIASSSKAYPSDNLYYYESGRKVSLDTYLSFLLKESDNTAMMHLENVVFGGNAAYNQRVVSELGLENLTRKPHTTTANQVGLMLQNIYHQKYLSVESNEYLIESMTDTAPRLHDRLKAGVEEYPEAVVAHKIGEVLTTNGLAFHDAGIIYGVQTDFALVVLNEDVSKDTAMTKIQNITELVYTELNPI